MLTKINNHFFPDKTDIKQNFIYLKGDITTESCAAAIENIVALNYPETELDSEGFSVAGEYPDVINLFITSSGGDMSAGFALINVIRGSRIPVRTIALGEACSAALCILMSGAQRVATPFTSLMSHQFLSSSEGSYDDLVNATVAFKNYHLKMLHFYVQCTQLSESYIKKHLLTSKDYYFEPEKAVEYNIVDLVVDLM